jgi:hypothetical protein
MGMRELEREVLAGARALFNNSHLKMKDILEWSTGEIEHVGRPREVVGYVPGLGVYVAIDKEKDKRKDNTTPCQASN